MDEVCISMDPLLEYISRKLAESEGPGALDASQLREQFKKYDIAPVAQPVLGESGEISGVVFSLAENLEHYHVAMCQRPPVSF